jgi:hypothetical protein
MTEEELVDFAIQTINERDDWHVTHNGQALVGSDQHPAHWIGRRCYVGSCSGTETCIRVGDVDIHDPGQQNRLMEAVTTRARELQRKRFSELAEQPPEHEHRNRQTPWGQRVHLIEERLSKLEERTAGVPCPPQTMLAEMIGRGEIELPGECP